jgi:uncharacterized protein YdhG (YjbR/CyaY superfamily)
MRSFQSKIAEKETSMKVKQKSAQSRAVVNKRYEGFSAEEKAAMRERVKEQKLSARRADEENALLEAIAGMPETDRAMANRLHAAIKANVPALSPTTWYGMPAYNQDGKIVCFFQSAQKFKTRYATFGFSDQAHLDEGNVWPNAYALAKLTPADEARIIALVKKAVS